MKTLLILLTTAVSVSAYAGELPTGDFKCSEPTIHVIPHAQTRAEWLYSKIPFINHEPPTLDCKNVINEAIIRNDPNFPSFLARISSIDSPESILNPEARKRFGSISDVRMGEIYRLHLDRQPPTVPTNPRPTVQKKVENVIPKPLPSAKDVKWRGMVIKLDPAKAGAKSTQCAIAAAENADNINGFDQMLSGCLRQREEEVRSITDSSLDKQLDDDLSEVKEHKPKSIREAMIFGKGMLNDELKSAAPNTYNYAATSFYDIFTKKRMQCTSGTDFILLNAANSTGLSTSTEIAVAVLKPRHVLAAVAKSKENKQISAIESVSDGKGSTYILVPDGKLPKDTRVLLAEDYWMSRILEHAMLNKEEIQKQMLARAETTLGIKQGDITPVTNTETKTASITATGDALNESMFNFGWVDIPAGDQPRPMMDGVPPNMVGAGVIAKGRPFTPKAGPTDLTTFPSVPPPATEQGVPIAHMDKNVIVRQMKANLAHKLYVVSQQKMHYRSDALEVQQFLQAAINALPSEVMNYIENNFDQANGNVQDATAPIAAMPDMPTKEPHVGSKCVSFDRGVSDSPSNVLRQFCEEFSRSGQGTDSVTMIIESNNPALGNPLYFKYEMMVRDRMRTVSFESLPNGLLKVIITDSWVPSLY